MTGSAPESSAGSLERAFAAHLDRAHLLPATGPLIIAVSGGLDSTVLLHLLRFGGAVDPGRLVAVHVDHRMRIDSAADARFVRDRCAEWGVPLVEACLLVAPGSEAAARDERWHVLEEVRRTLGARAILTGHHRDDQAETVLHRILRGTGTRGIRGILPRRGPRVRPLLPWSRAELEDHARAHGLAWRHDVTNDEERYTRNRLRRRLIPALEAEMPGAREALARLAENARDDVAALAEASRVLLERLVQARDPLTLDRDGLLAYGPALRGQLLRVAAAGLGVHLGAGATRTAARFVAEAPSGSERHLTGGLVLARDFARITLRARPDTGAARGGAPDARVRWGEAAPAGVVDVVTLPADAVQIPFTLRAARPGDRMRLSYGTKKLKKLFGEARLDRGLRRAHPVVEDATGRIVWVPGVATCAPPPPPGEPALVVWLESLPREPDAPGPADPESPET